MKIQNRSVALLLLVSTGFALGSCGQAQLLATLTALSAATAWTKDCAATGSKYYRASHTFTSTAMTGTTTIYSDSTCATVYAVRTNVATITQGAASSSVSGGINYNFTWTSITETPKTATAVTDYNGSGGFCGSTSWALDTAKSVSGLTCGTGIRPTNGATQYDVLALGSNYLQFGDTSGTNTGTTDALRPTSLATAKYYQQ